MSPTPQWSEASIIDAIQRWAERHGRPPRREDWKHAAVGRPRAWTVRYHIGWSEALVRAGFAPHHRTDRWSEAAIIAAIRRWADEHNGVPPAPSDWQRAGDGHPNAGTVYNRIGWNTAILRAGFTPRGRRPKWSDAAIIAAIQRWADRHDGVPPTFADRVQETDEHPAGWTVYNRIGCSEALSNAGFPTIARPKWSGRGAALSAGLAARSLLPKLITDGGSAVDACPAWRAAVSAFAEGLVPAGPASTSSHGPRRRRGPRSRFGCRELVIAFVAEE